MVSEAQKKVEFIVAWYNKERMRFSFSKQVLLAKTWMDICAKNDEYEMSLALQQEKEKITKLYFKEKRKNRTWSQKLNYYCIKFIRKFKK